MKKFGLALAVLLALAPVAARADDRPEGWDDPRSGVVRYKKFYINYNRAATEQDVRKVIAIHHDKNYPFFRPESVLAGFKNYFGFTVYVTKSRLLRDLKFREFIKNEAQLLAIALGKPVQIKVYDFNNINRRLLIKSEFVLACGREKRHTLHL